MGNLCRIGNNSYSENMENYMKHYPLLSALLAATILCSAPAAMAKPHDKHWSNHDRDDDYDWNDRHDRDHDWNDRHDRDHDHDRVYFRDNDRVVIRRYMVEDYHHHCPPGLAKKHNGCMPPGQAKKHYVIGQRLPTYVRYEPVPRAWVTELEPVPYGYQYVRVDNDVLLMNQASHEIIDAITLMSAVGH
jgi:Ni/Co efflux regulator RcnB